MTLHDRIAAKKMTGDTWQVRARQRIEQEIALSAVKQLLANGYTLGVYDGEELTIHHSRDEKAIEAALFTTDDDYLYVYLACRKKSDKDWRPDYWVRFVYGNDGWDVISDYSLHLEPCLSIANGLSDYFESN